MEKEVIHLVVEHGPDAGLEISVPPEGGRIGRSSANAIVLSDPSLSRFHCRVFFKDGVLWIGDLGSTNKTLLNDKAVVEQALNPGDVIEIGETFLRVRNVRLDGSPAASSGQESVNLGFGPEHSQATGITSSVFGRPVVWLVAIIALLLVAAAVLFKNMDAPAGPEIDSARSGPPALDIYYEKVRADESNIFRYELTLHNRRLSVRVDNLEDGRHLQRESELNNDLLARLAGDLDRFGFYSLQPVSEGIAPDVFDQLDLTITMGRRAHSVRVRNRLEPEAFQKTREVLEEFARNELGLAALALPPEQLLELGSQAILQGRKLIDEREVRHENLWGAIRAYEEALWYLDSMEPKPEAFPDAVRGLQMARDLLNERYEQQLFQADRAITLRDWQSAARHLRIICELIPDRNDERHSKAADRLLDVERRLGR